MGRRRDTNPIANLSSTMAEAFDELRSEWRIGSTSRYMPRPGGVSTNGSNADWHWRDPNRYFLAVERARHWDRNNLVVAQGVDRLVDNVLGERGPELTPKTPDEELNKDLRARFYEWADDATLCDVEARQDFWQLSWLAFRNMIIDGDVLGVGLSSGELQTFENHRLKTPTGTKKNVIQGILLSDVGKPLEYWVTKNDIGVRDAVKLVSAMSQLAARDADGTPLVFHAMVPRRLSQHRGVTPLAPCADAVPMHDDLQFATMIKAKVASCWAIIEEVDANAPAPPKLGGAGDTDKLGSRSTAEREDGESDVLEQIAPGMRIRGRRGVKYQGFSPNIPSDSFFDHALLLLTFISINLGIPLAVLLLDGKLAGNFSSWRGAIEQARQSFRRLQRKYGSCWFSQIYRWKVAQFIAEDNLLQKMLKKHGKQIFSHDWQSPAWEYIQPQQDAQADLMKLAGCLDSMTAIHAKRNRNWGDVSSEITVDNAMLIRKAHVQAQLLNTELGLLGTPHELTWRDVAALPLPQGVTMQFGQPQNEPAPEPARGKAA